MRERDENAYIRFFALWFAAGITAGKFDWLTPAALQQSIGYSFFGAFNPFLVHY